MYHEVKIIYTCFDMYTVLYLPQSLFHLPEPQKISSFCFVHDHLLKAYQNV